jgi:hypothetical protein
VSVANLSVEKNQRACSQCLAFVGRYPYDVIFDCYILLRSIGRYAILLRLLLFSYGNLLLRELSLKSCIY